MSDSLLLHLEQPGLLYGSVALADEILHHLGGAILTGKEERGAAIGHVAHHVLPVEAVELLQPPDEAAGQSRNRQIRLCEKVEAVTWSPERPVGTPAAGQ